MKLQRLRCTQNHGNTNISKNMDVLIVIESEDIKLECKNSMSPTIIKSTVDESFLSVIMPLRVEW